MNATFKSILELIKAGDIRISEHGYDELAEDGLTVTEILEGVGKAQPVEDYPTFPKGPAVLVLQFDRDSCRYTRCGACRKATAAPQYW